MKAFSNDNAMAGWLAVSRREFICKSNSDETIQRLMLSIIRNK
jgi:hypothetical protein